MIHEGDLLHGFTVKSVEWIEEYHGYGIFCLHNATGLELFHLLNDDPENFFAFIFQTAPKNSRGAAHIVEHSVLSGSQHFPVKDPFMMLISGSAQTFLNAITYPDKTVYPGASPIKQDYWNLLRVYGDAVFFPLLRKQTFQQEGIRLTVGDDGDFRYDGIVFNEMKGAYSSHDDIVFSASVRSLFPDTPIHFDSGGDPREIISLTYEEFKGFHAANYHPSNCRIFLYGNIPTEEQLNYLQREFLNDFTPIKVDKYFKSPKRWKKPKYIIETSPLEEADEVPDSSAGATADKKTQSAKSSITINWLTRSALEPVNLVTYDILTEVLLGNPGAPLYEAVIESGLGEDISQVSGMDGDLKDIVFSVGIRNCSADAQDAFEQLVFDTLREITKNGLDSDDLASAVKRIEFRERELRGGLPVGLRCMSKSLRGWMHGRDPAETLRFIPILEEVKRNQQKDPQYFERIIKEDLLENSHRTVVTVTPDAAHTKKFDVPIESSLQNSEKSSSKKTVKKLQDESKALKQFQEVPDSEEDRDTVPVLHREDLPEEIRQLKLETASLHTGAGEVPFFYSPYHTNGILYLDISFNTEGLTYEEHMLLPLLSRLIYMTSLPGMSYSQVSKRIAHLTGGFSTYLDAGTPMSGRSPWKQPLRKDGALDGRKQEDFLQMLVFQLKCLEEDSRDALVFLRDILLKADLSNPQRIRTVIMEKRNDFSASLIPSGTNYTLLRASAAFSSVSAREEQWRGIEQFLYLSSIQVEDEKQIQAAAEKMVCLRSKLLVQSRVLVHATADRGFRTSLEEQLKGLLAALPAEDASGSDGSGAESSLSSAGGLRDSDSNSDSDSESDSDSNSRKVNIEALLSPAKVAFTTLACRSAQPGTKEQICQGLLANILSVHHLYELIRIQGGAYGAFCSISLLEGTAAFSSYRDPRIVQTLKAYRTALEQAVRGIPEEFIEQAVISAVAKEVRPLVPSEKGMLGFKRSLYGITDQFRRERREYLLSIKEEDLKQCAEFLLQQLDETVTVVLASRALVETESRSMPILSEHTLQLPL